MSKKIASAANANPHVKYFVISAFAVVGVVLIVAINAATKNSVSVDAPALSGAASQTDDAAAFNGSYVDFGTGGDDPVGDIPDGTIKAAYPAPPAVNGSTVVRVTSQGDMMAKLRDSSVQTIILADGNYQGGSSVIFDGIKNKTLWAENRYGAVFNPNYRNQSMAIVNTDNFTLRGIAILNSSIYAVRAGGEGYTGYQGRNINLTFDHIKIDGAGQSAIGINNGWGSSGSGCSVRENSKNVTVSSSIFTNIGVKATSIPMFTEIIYVGSGGDCQFYDKVEGLTIKDNVFIGESTNQGGEAIGIKAHTEDILIEGNYVKGFRMHDATDNAPVGVWIDKGLPRGNRATATAGPKGIIIRNNYIGSVTNYPGNDYPDFKANGITVGHAATIENNLIENTGGAAVYMYIGGVFNTMPPASTGICDCWGFSNGTENKVVVKNNTFKNNGHNSYQLDLKGARPPAWKVEIESSNNTGTMGYPEKEGYVEWTINGETGPKCEMTFIQYETGGAWCD